MNLISDQSQESLPVFSPKKMTRRSTMFCLPPKSPSTDEPAEEARTGTFIIKAFSMQYDGKTFEFRINGMSSLLLFLENVLSYSRY